MTFRAPLVAIILANFSAPVAASTFTTLIKANNQVCALESNSTGTTTSCNGQIVTPTTAPATTDYSVTSRADPGSIGVAGQMSTVGDAVDFFEATASIVDTLFFGIDSGTVTVSVDLAGDRLWSLPAFNPSFGPGSANANTAVALSMNAYLLSGPTLSALDEVYFETLSFFPAFQAGPTITTRGSLGTSTFSFGFSGGSLDIAAVLGMTLSCRSGINFGGCSTSVDFLNSLRFTGAQVFDVTGGLVQTSVTSASGFDYATGLPPHGGGGGPSPAPIPLPAPAALLMVALALLGLFKRRDRLAG